MTQPPPEPRDGPDEGRQPQWQPQWQPPGPPPQRPGPQQPPPNPYGGGTTDFYRPIDTGRMSSGPQVVIGVVIGVLGGFFLWLFAAIGFASGSSGSGDGFLVLAAIVPLLVPAPLLIWKATRPWAVGLLMGTAVVSIGLSSLCSSMISGFEGGA